MITGKAITKEVENGVIRIHPFKRENVSINSYDLTLGEWCIRYIGKETPGSNTYHPYRRLDEEHSLDMYEEPHKSISDYLKLSPHERILTHTAEFAGAYDKYVPKIATKSTLARWGLDVCASAGFGDVGYVNRWTLELYNFTNHTLWVPIGAKICQIYFEPVFDEEGHPARNIPKYAGAYQTALRDWKPEDMLPLPLKK